MALQLEQLRPQYIDSGRPEGTTSSEPVALAAKNLSFFLNNFVLVATSKMTLSSEDAEDFLRKSINLFKLCSQKGH